MKKLVCLMLAAVLALCIAAVSYTHLDVYKRQGMSRLYSAKGAFAPLKQLPAIRWIYPAYPCLKG